MFKKKLRKRKSKTNFQSKKETSSTNPIFVGRATKQNSNKHRSRRNIKRHKSYEADS